MSKNLRRFLVIAGCFALVAGLAVPTQAADLKKPKRIVIITGSTGGSWYAYAAGMVPIFKANGIDATTIPGGGAVNPLKISKAEGDIAFGQTSANFDASQGKGAFKKYGKIGGIMNIALVSADHVHVICTEASGIASWEDLPKSRFSAPAISQASWGNFLAGLSAYGIDPNSLKVVSRGSMERKARDVKDRHADCTTHTSAWPVAGFSELAVSVPIKVLGMPKDKIEAVTKINPGLIPGVIPKNAYPGMTEDVNVYRAGSVMMTHSKLSMEKGYWIVKIIGDNIDKVRKIHKGLARLTVEDMAKAPVFEMHPGAALYYKERGLK